MRISFRVKFFINTIFLLLAQNVMGLAVASQCDANFNSTGSFLSGKTYQTYADLPNISEDVAYMRAYNFVAKEGWKIQKNDAGSRHISAADSTSFNRGKIVPLDVTVQSISGGSKIVITYSTPAGMSSPEDAVKSHFCNLVASATVDTPSLSSPAGRTDMTPPVSGDQTVPSSTRIAESKDSSTQASSSRQVDGAKLCLGKACLGMSVDEVAKLDLEPAGTFKFSIYKGTDKGLKDAFGLDVTGQRVWFSSIGDFDKKTISQFSERVKTVCAVKFLTAYLKASDGQRITLLLRPTIANGKGRLVVSEISRKLPPNMSASEMKSFENQVREKYGDVFVSTYSLQVKKPSVRIQHDFATGTALNLLLPTEDVFNQLLEQPGCTDKPRLD